MLIIYGALNLGGIETFFLRLAKERYYRGEITKIIFTIPKNKGVYNNYLYTELGKYCEIFHFEDIFIKKFLNWRFHLLHELDLEEIGKILADCDYIHVAEAYSGLIADSILKKLKINLPIIFGVYHTMEYSWGNIKTLPYFEIINRQFIYKNNKSNNILCFSDDTKKILEQRVGLQLKDAQTFRLGVIEAKNEIHIPEVRNKELKICAVGRLTNFKTYNFWMPQVIEKLREKGYLVTLDLYGSGECESKIQDIIAKHANYVRLFPEFNYSEFSNIVTGYDLFIGSGTAIIEASSLGIPSIIGIESLNKPLSYGYFSDFSAYEYNVMGLPFELKEVESFIEAFIHLNVFERKALAIAHKKAAEMFEISMCNKNIENMEKKIAPYFNFNLWIYYLSRFLFYKKIKFLKKTIYHDFI